MKTRISLDLDTGCSAGAKQRWLRCGTEGKRCYLEEEDDVPYQPEHQRGVAVCYFRCIDAN